MTRTLKSTLAFIAIWAIATLFSFFCLWILGRGHYYFGYNFGMIYLLPVLLVLSWTSSGISTPALISGILIYSALLAALVFFIWRRLKRRSKNRMVVERGYETPMRDKMMTQLREKLTLKSTLRFLAIWFGIAALNWLCFYYLFDVFDKTQMSPAQSQFREYLTLIHMLPMRIIHFVTGTHVFRFSLLIGLVINSLLLSMLLLKIRRVLPGRWKKHTP